MSSEISSKAIYAASWNIGSCVRDNMYTSDKSILLAKQLLINPQENGTWQGIKLDFSSKEKEKE